MKTKKTLLPAIALSVLSACASGPDIIYNSDPSVNVAGYSTFAFFDPLGTDTKGYGSLTSQYLKSATRTKLESLGYTYDETNPQLRINFGGQLSDKLRVSSAPTVGVGYYGYRAGMYGAWGGYNQTTVSQYTEGTLNLDVVDVAANRMVWESVANGRVTEEDLKNVGPVLTEGVGEMLSKFPPHAAR